MIQEKIGPGQFFLLVVLFTVGASILITPPLVTHFAKQDAWIAGLLTILLAMGIIMIYIKLSEHYPNNHLFEMCEIILGKWFGKLMASFFLLFLLFLTAYQLEIIANFLRIKILPGTPKEVFYVTFLLMVVAAVYSGLEVIARAAQLFLPFLLILYTTATLLTGPLINIKEVLPIFEFGFKPTLLATLNFLAFPFLQLFILTNLVPQINTTTKTRKFFYIGVLIGGAILVLEIVLTIVILGVHVTMQNVYPTYLINKQINLLDFFQRMEALIAFFWTVTLLFKTIICFYSFSIGFTSLFKIYDYRPFVIPLSTIVLAFTVFLSPNAMKFGEFSLTAMPIICWIVGFFCPVILLFVSSIRNRRKKKQQTQSIPQQSVEGK